MKIIDVLKETERQSSDEGLMLETSAIVSFTASINPSTLS